MESRFYLPLQLTTRGRTRAINAPFLPALPIGNIHLLSQVCVLSDSEPTRGLPQGLYVWNGQRWVLGMEQTYVSNAFKNLYDVHVYDRLESVPTSLLTDRSIVFRNGQKISYTSVTPDGQVWVILTPMTTDNGGGSPVVLDQYVDYAVSLPTIPAEPGTVFYLESTNDLFYVGLEVKSSRATDLEQQYEVIKNGAVLGRITVEASATHNVPPFNLAVGDTIALKLLTEVFDNEMSLSVIFKFKL